MKCPYCSCDETKVVDKRETSDLAVTRRRRECLKCSKRFTTYERAELGLMIIKKDNTRTDFDREKLKKGIQKACEKRPISPEQIDAIVDKIENDIRNLDTTEVKSSFIGNRVMSRLKSLDKVAYIRFASVYREFGDIESFGKEIEKLSKKR
ncbi:transcriptional regulator NrdR [Candidatus Woesearchaeota archaeon]|nr:transcriptional regulator NrdR [Candidatus Woesearchaeota archaeon]